MPYSHLTHLECSRCGTRLDPDVLQGLCGCGGPLLARYDLPSVGRALTPEDVARRGRDLWRYHELLPVRAEEAVVTFGEGMTPLVDLARTARAVGVGRLLMKDEGVLPTGTFKARGAAAGVSRARELGASRIVMPTNGNAGAAWAAYAARAGLGTCVVMPEDAPEITRRECVVSGADLYLVRGLIGDAGAIAARAASRHGWFDVSTLKEPYRIEGKKTMGFEIAEQLGWRVPTVIIYPTGGGVGIIGIYKALRELQALGWIKERLPRLVAVQASGCAPVVRAFEQGRSDVEAWADAKTAAFGINVAHPLGGALVLAAVAATGGCALSVADDELLTWQHRLAREEGCFVCPEGAATLAAAERLAAAGWLSAADEVVLLNTGTGIKYPETVPVSVPTLAVGDDLPVR